MINDTEKNVTEDIIENTERISPKPLPHSRSTKDESEKINRRILELLGQNKDWRDIYYILKKELKEQYGKEYSKPALHKRYQECVAEIQNDIKEDIEETRAKRIKSLKKDLEEAYTRYTSEPNPKIKQDWFKIYIDVKNNLDKFYPNALQPKEESDDLNICIKFKDVE